MCSRAPFLLCCASLLCLAQTAESPQNMAEMSSRDAPVTFSTGVNLILVPVVVRDKLGRAIGTLRQEDFRLSDKGKPQVISKFSVEKFSKTGAPVIAVEADPG